jgi:hypothetical protein
MMALGLNQPLTEISTRNISCEGGLRRLERTAYHLNVPNVLKSGSLKLLEPSGPVQACNGTAVSFCLYLNNPRKVFSVYRGCRGVVPFIFNRGTRCRWIVR